MIDETCLAQSCAYLEKQILGKYQSCAKTCFIHVVHLPLTGTVCRNSCSNHWYGAAEF